MVVMHQPLAALAIASVSVLALAGCAGTPNDIGDGDAGLTVVASTNVYGSLAAQIGGDRVDVTSIIDTAAQDPHSYEASARDRLAVQGADLVIANGGGYDSFMNALLEGSEAHALTAIEFSHALHGEQHEESDAAVRAADEHDHDHADKHDHADEHGDEDDHEGHGHIAGFNEHVWFDAHTMIHVVEGIATELGELDPDGASDFEAAASEIIAELEGMEVELEELATEFAGTGVFITEPLPGYLAEAIGLENLTPDRFAESVEEGADVAPATLLAAIDVIESGEVAVLLTNAQTGGSETKRAEQTAEAAGVPVVAFTELLEDGSSYAGWMHAAIQSLADALRS